MASRFVSSCRMELKQAVLLHVLLMAFYLVLCIGFEAGSISREEDLEFQRQLKILNKHPIKSVQNEDGSIVDCIEINNQPAFDHPLLQNHTIQMRPSSFPKGMTSRDSSQVNWFNEPILESVGCPLGTVPIQRTRKKDLIAAKSILKRGVANTNSETSISFIHHFATLRAVGGSKSMPFYGAKGFNSIRGPQISDKQFSSAAIWIQNRESDQINSLQFGWTVNPMLYGDNQTRLYSAWTADAFNKTGCLNTLCPGFVQVNSQYHLGQTVPVSGYYDLKLIRTLIFQDRKTGNWWLCMGNVKDNYEVLGYWPKSILTSLNGYASHIEFGGEVFGPSSDHVNMGSSVFQEGNYHSTSFFSNIQIVDGTNTLVDPNHIPMEMVRDYPTCYHVEYNGYKDHTFNHIMLFGGPVGWMC